MKNLKVGDRVLVQGVVKSIESDGLVEVSILDGNLPRVADVFIWPKSLIQPPLNKKEK